MTEHQKRVMRVVRGIEVLMCVFALCLVLFSVGALFVVLTP